MARPVTERVRDIRCELESRLRSGPLRPGERFYSNRSLAQKYGISYQTAHRLLSSLEQEGLLRRSRASGTYASGGTKLSRIELCFHQRARKEGSFGARLLQLLERALEAASIEYRRVWINAPYTVPSDVYPILWEAEDGGRVGFEGPHPFGLILNDRPAPGLRSSYLDSISADDYSGGAMAAELLLDRGFKPRQMALLGGPQRDRRSQSRILGFLSVVRKVSVTYAESWYYEEGCRMASRVLREKPAGVFCANDRLAAAVQDVARERLGEKAPDLVGYDNAPIALERGLTTIGIPWEEMALGAAAIACARIKGDTGPARAQIFAPRPVLRWERG